jgi:hypothetical protein
VDGDERERRVGVRRRVPGATLPAGPSPEHSSATSEIAVLRREVRDADADRRAFDDYATGLARANESVSSGGPIAVANDGQPRDPKKESAK